MRNKMFCTSKGRRDPNRNTCHLPVAAESALFSRGPEKQPSHALPHCNPEETPSIKGYYYPTCQGIHVSSSQAREKRVWRHRRERGPNRSASRSSIWKRVARLVHEYEGSIL